MKYDTVRSFIVGQSTQLDVLKSFGEPTARIDSKGHYSFRYDDPVTGFQRLTMNFLSENNKLADILWIPQSSENEHALKQTLSGFKGRDFKEVNEENNNPHYISLGSVFYIDKKGGVTIRYNRDQKSVEGIAIYHADIRLPAEQKMKAKGPYTFTDDE